MKNDWSILSSFLASLNLVQGQVTVCLVTRWAALTRCIYFIISLSRPQLSHSLSSPERDFLIQLDPVLTTIPRRDAKSFISGNLDSTGQSQAIC